jgi:hypothetical protein
VSSDGDVLTLKRRIPELRAPNLDPRGRHRHTLFTPAGRAYVFGHQLVLEAFVGPRPPGQEVNHKDGNPSNNRLENLEYVTKSENITHSYRVLGRRATMCNAKLTDSQVKDLRQRARRGTKQTTLAKTFGISTAQVSMAVNRKSYTHI